MRIQQPLTKENVLKTLTANKVVSDECWLYDYGIHRTGYAYIMFSGRRLSVHRLSAWIFHDLDLKDIVTKVCHKTNCPNKNCWNPDHIYLGTQKDNIRDSMELGSHVVFGR